MKLTYSVLFDLGSGSYVDHYSFLLNPHFSSDTIITIGKNVGIENGCHIDYPGGLVIGDDVWISEFVFVATHGYTIDSKERKKLQPHGKVNVVENPTHS